MEEELFEPTLCSSYNGGHCAPSVLYESDLAFRTAPLLPASQRHTALIAHGFHKGSTRQRCRALYRSSRLLTDTQAEADANMCDAPASRPQSSPLSATRDRRRVCGAADGRRSAGSARNEEVVGGDGEAALGAVSDENGNGAFAPPIALCNPADPYGHSGDVHDTRASAHPIAASPARVQFAKHSMVPASSHRFYTPDLSRNRTAFSEKTVLPTSWASYPTSAHGARTSYHSAFIPSYSIQHEIRCHDGCINSIHTDPRGEYLLTGSDDLTVCLYRTDTWQQVWKTATEHRANIFNAVFVPYQGQSQILTCGLDGQTLLMDVSSQHTTTLASFSAMASSIVFPAATPTTAYVAYGDGHIVRVDARCSPVRSATLHGTDAGVGAANLSLGSPLGGFVSHVHALATHPRHPYTIASATDSSFAFFHDIRMGSARAYAAMGLDRLRGGAVHDVDDGIGGLSFSSRGDWLAVNYRGDDLYLIPWEHELYDGPLQPPTYYGHDNDAYEEDSASAAGAAGAFSASSPSVAVKHVVAMEGTDKRTVPLLLSRRYIALRGRRNSYTMFKEVAWMADDTVVATGSDDGQVYLWSTASGRLLHTTKGDGDVVNGVLYHPGSGALVTCGIDSSFKVLKPDVASLMPAPPRPQRAAVTSALVQQASPQASRAGPPEQTSDTVPGLAAADSGPAPSSPRAAATPTTSTTTAPTTTAVPDSVEAVPPPHAPLTATQMLGNLILPFLSPLVTSESPSEAGSRGGTQEQATPLSTSPSPTPLPRVTPSPPSRVDSGEVVRAEAPQGQPYSAAGGAPANTPAVATAVDSTVSPTQGMREATGDRNQRGAERDTEGSWSTMNSDSDDNSRSSASITPSSSSATFTSTEVSLHPSMSAPPFSASHTLGREGAETPEPVRIPSLRAPAVAQLRQRVLEKVCEMQSAMVRAVTPNTTTLQLSEVLSRLQRCRTDAETFQASLMDWDWDDGEDDDDEDDDDDDDDDDNDDGDEEDDNDEDDEVDGALFAAAETSGEREQQPRVRVHMRRTSEAVARGQAGTADQLDHESANRSEGGDEWEDVHNDSSASTTNASFTTPSSSSSSSSGDWDGLLAPVEMLIGLGASVTRDRSGRDATRDHPGRAADTAVVSSATGGHDSRSAARREAEVVAAEQQEQRQRAAEVLSSSAHLHAALRELICTWYYYDPARHGKRRVQYCLWHRSLTDRAHANYHHGGWPTSPQATPSIARGLNVTPTTFYDLLAQHHGETDVEAHDTWPAPLRPVRTGQAVSADAPSGVGRRGPPATTSTRRSSSTSSGVSRPSPVDGRGLLDTASPASLLQDVRLITAEFSISLTKIHCLLQLETIYLQGKEALFYTPQLRRQYWTRRASLQLQWIYYCMAIGDLSGVRCRTEELDSWWEYAAIVALGSASPSFLASHAAELAKGVVCLSGVVQTGKAAHRAHATFSRKRSRRWAEADGEAAQQPSCDGDRDEMGQDDSASDYVDKCTSESRVLLVNCQSWRLVPNVHSDNAAHDGGCESHPNKATPSKTDVAVATASQGTWLPKLLVPLALRYRAVSQRLADPSVLLFDCPRLTPRAYAQERAMLIEERRRVREELERRIAHHPHTKMVKKVRQMFEELGPD